MIFSYPILFAQSSCLSIEQHFLKVVIGEFVQRNTLLYFCFSSSGNDPLYLLFLKYPHLMFVQKKIPSLLLWKVRISLDFHVTFIIRH